MVGPDAWQSLIHQGMIEAPDSEIEEKIEFWQVHSEAKKQLFNEDKEFHGEYDMNWGVFYLQAIRRSFGDSMARGFRCAERRMLMWPTKTCRKSSENMLRRTTLSSRRTTTASSRSRASQRIRYGSSMGTSTTSSACTERSSPIKVGQAW